MAIGTITFDAVLSDDSRSVKLSVLADNMTRLVKIERVAPTELGTQLVVRGTLNAPTPGGAWTGQDFEAPAGGDLVYRVTAEDESDSTTGTATVTVSGGVDYGGDWIMPVGRPNLGMNIYVEYGGVAGLEYRPQRDVISVINRRDPVVVSFGMSDWETTFRFITLTGGERASLLTVLNSPVVMFVARPGFGFALPLFLSPGTVTEERTVGLGSEESRRFAVGFTKVASPPAFYATDLPYVNWQSKVDNGDTWQSVSDSGVIWFDFAEYRIT